jgi:hypothetical protein
VSVHTTGSIACDHGRGAHRPCDQQHTADRRSTAAVRASAASAGWSRTTQGDFCPDHTPQAVPHRRYTTGQHVDVYDPYRDTWDRARITDVDLAGHPTWATSTGNDIAMDLRDIAPAYIRPHAEGDQT